MACDGNGNCYNRVSLGQLSALVTSRVANGNCHYLCTALYLVDVILSLYKPIPCQPTPNNISSRLYSHSSKFCVRETRNQKKPGIKRNQESRETRNQEKPGIKRNQESKETRNQEKPGIKRNQESRETRNQEKPGILQGFIKKPQTDNLSTLFHCFV